MADENKTPSTQEELDIFGAHRTDEELAAEAAQKRAEEKAARRAAYEQAKAARKEANKETRTVRIVMGCILAAVVVAVAVILVFNLRPANSKYDEVEGSAHFYREDDLPEASEEGITGIINEAYFTKGGHLALKMKFTNGAAKTQNLDTLEVTVENGDEEKIASGYTASINGGDFPVPVGEYKELIFYISPEYVLLKDDPLETLGYTITCGGSDIQ